MGYVFDGEMVLGKAGFKAPQRVFPRFLAVVLLLLAGFIGVPIGALMITAACSGAAPIFGLAALASPLVLICGRIGWLLWSSQSPPRRLVVSGVLVVLASVVAILFVVFVCYVAVVVAIS